MKEITAGSFNRVMSQLDKTSCCFITAFRGHKYDEGGNETDVDASHNDNRKRNKNLEADIRSSGLAFYRCKGGYMEKDLNGESREVTEDTFCVANNKFNDEDFVNLMIDLGSKYDQDSILITFPKKEKDERKVTSIIGRYYCTSPRTGNVGEVLDEFDNLSVSDISEYFTKLYGKSFTLEKISSNVSKEVSHIYGLNSNFLGSVFFEEHYPHLAVKRKKYASSVPEKLRVASSLHNKYVAKDLGSALSLEDVVKLAHRQPVGMISAITEDNSNDPKAREEATHNLEVTIADRYDFFRVYGGWVNSDGSESTEESFVVLGSLYSEDSTDKHNEIVLNNFKKDMIKWCGEFKQQAVLIISKAEDISRLSPEILEKRDDAYRVFSDPRFLKVLTREEYRDMKDSLEDAQKILSNPEYTEQFEEWQLSGEVNTFLEYVKEAGTHKLYSLEAKYYDSNGNVTMEFNNVTPKQIGQYFTSLAREIGAKRFTILAHNLRYVAKRLQWNPRQKYILREVTSSKDRYGYILSNRKGINYDRVYKSELRNILEYLGKPVTFEVPETNSSGIYVK